MQFATTTCSTKNIATITTNADFLLETPSHSHSASSVELLGECFPPQCETGKKHMQKDRQVDGNLVNARFTTIKFR
jgi:hypothetical protein